MLKTERQSYFLPGVNPHNKALCSPVNHAIVVCDDTSRRHFMCGGIHLVEHLNPPNIEGDQVSKNSKITVGQKAIATIKQIKCDIYFSATNAIDFEHGVSDNDWKKFLKCIKWEFGQCDEVILKEKILVKIRNCRFS